MPQSEETKIAVLETQFQNLADKIDDMKKGQEKLQLTVENLTAKIDDAYLKKEEFNRFYRDEFSTAQNQINRLFWWIISTLVAAIGGLLMALFNYFTSRRH